MNNRLYLPVDKNVRIRPDFSSRPVTILLPRDRRLAVIVLAFVCIWGAIGTVGTFGIPAVLMQYAQGVNRLWLYALALAGTIAPLFIGWAAMRHYVSNDTITIGKNEVCFTRTQLFSKIRWCEPLSAFSGVKNRSLPVSLNNKTRNYQIVDLVHPEADKSLPVFVDRGTSLPAPLLQDLATSLEQRILTSDEAPPPTSRPTEC